MRLLALALATLAACETTGDADRVARLEDRARAAEAQIATLRERFTRAGFDADDAAGRWWCNAGKCSRFQGDCEREGAACSRQRIAFCIRIALCYASLPECFGAAPMNGVPPAACAGVE